MARRASSTTTTATATRQQSARLLRSYYCVCACVLCGATESLLCMRAPGAVEKKIRKGGVRDDDKRDALSGCARIGRGRILLLVGQSQHVVCACVFDSGTGQLHAECAQTNRACSNVQTQRNRFASGLLPMAMLGDLIEFVGKQYEFWRVFFRFACLV